ncbi:MAG: ATP synthase subunit epsilon family protein [archaeon]|nr:ATP synthase subunit epsilon family protein [archaeon]
MSTPWRKAGWTFVRATNTAASLVRRSLKPEVRAEAMKRDTPIVTIQYWGSGKPVTIEPFERPQTQ